jgi:hypothetical protein
MTVEKKSFLLPASAERPSNTQRLFLRYFTGILIDLTVLNLFVEYSKNVVIDSFTISLFAAVLLQVLLKATIALEHVVANYFKKKPGGLAKFCGSSRRGSSCSVPSSSSSRRLSSRSGTTFISAGGFTELLP